VGMFNKKITEAISIREIVSILADADEYAELPVRHNEDSMNADLAETVPWPVKPFTYDSPHTKAMLLLQCHFGRLPLPISDYVTDLKSVLDQAIRILQAMVDVAAEKGFLNVSIEIMHTMQMVKQGRFFDQSHLLFLPNMENLQNSVNHLSFQGKPISSPLGLMALSNDTVFSLLKPHLSYEQIRQVQEVLNVLPNLQIRLNIEREEEQHEDSKNESEKTEVLKRGEECQLIVDLVIKTKAEKQKGKKNLRQAYTPKFPKPQTESWWLLLADKGRDELLALKRVSFGDKTTCSLSFQAPEKAGHYEYQVFMISDAYLGLDVEHQIGFDVI